MAVNNSLVQQAAKPTFSAFLTKDAIKNKINEIVGGKDGQRFMTQIISAVTNNPALQACEQMSILNCAFLGESLKLSPSPQLGQYYMVPFKTKVKDGDQFIERNVATFQLGYKGYIQLAIRSGQYKKLNVLAIKEGELVRYDPLNEEIEVNLMDDEAARENAPTVGYYAMFEYTNGFRKTLYWSKAKMEAHALKYSQGYASDKKNNRAYTYWSKDFDGMAFKTMLRQIISKWGIMSIEMLSAMEKDMSVVDDKGNATSYVDNDFVPVEEPTVQAEVTQQNVEQEIPFDDVPDFLKEA